MNFLCQAYVYCEQALTGRIYVSNAMAANTTEEVFQRILVQVSGAKELKLRAFATLSFRIDKIQLVMLGETNWLFLEKN
jgi:hypothetical protein